MDIHIKGWKVVGMKGEGEYARKVDLSRTFAIKSSAEEFHRIAVKDNATAMVETVYLTDDRGNA